MISEHWEFDINMQRKSFLSRIKNIQNIDLINFELLEYKFEINKLDLIISSLLSAANVLVLVLGILEIIPISVLCCWRVILILHFGHTI